LKLDCRRCTSQEKIDNGCQRKSPIPGVWKFGEWEFDRCPKKIVKSQDFEYIRAFNFYKEGFFPNQGGWSEQPIKLLEVFEYIQKVIDDRDDRDKETK
jgi:hypothetical protein